MINSLVEKDLETVVAILIQVQISAQESVSDTKEGDCSR
jgi:hypothetical protein